MTFFPDDQAGLFVPVNTETPPRYTVGVLRQWDPVTFDNVVEWRGTTMEGLAVINRVEALSFVEGQNVALLGMSGTGDLVSFAILGSYLVPGTDAGTEAVAFLQSELARQISAEIFADRITAAQNNATVTAPGTSYSDLGGPEVTVEIGATGTALVFLSAVITGTDTSTAPGDAAQVGGRMSFEVTGATTQSPSNERSLATNSAVGVGGALAVNLLGNRSGVLVVASGLNPGTHTFNCLYACLYAAVDMDFADRAIGVIAF